MKKMNKKGFTLIELLAVIVVLAIIMVIATQQVNKTIKKARTNSFNESMQTVVKTAKLLIAESDLSTDKLKESLDISEADYTVYVSGGDSQSGTIVIEATSNGKFNNVDFNLMSANDKNSSYLYDGTNKRICTEISDAGTLTAPEDSCPDQAS